MRRLSISVIALLIAALAVPTAASAGSPRDRATGGGQILIESNPNPAGRPTAGSTIAFTAQGSETDARGQIQWIDRTAGKGQNQVRGHYIVNCVSVEGNDVDNDGVDDEAAAYISGYERDTGEAITLFVVDNGEGALADMDIVAINPVGDDDSDDGPCGVTEPSASERENFGLARGNAQTYDADAS